MGKTDYRLLLKCRLFWAVLTCLFIFVSCRSGPKRPEDMNPRERATEATSLVRAGKEAAERGDIDSALLKFERALELTPDNPKARRDYAELLYFKAQAYSYQSDEMWFRSLGKEFDEASRIWKQSGAVVPPEQKAELGKNADEALNNAVLYFRKSLDQLELLNTMVGGSDEDVICAMGFIHALLFEFDQAKACFEHVLESPVVKEEIKEKIRKAIEAIDEYQKEQRSSPER